MHVSTSSTYQCWPARVKVIVAQHSGYQAWPRTTFLRSFPATNNSPDPSRASVPGSGTGTKSADVAVVCVRPMLVEEREYPSNVTSQLPWAVLKSTGDEAPTLTNVS